MTKVFIAGSRRLSRLNADVKRRIDTMIEKRFMILVGDANGADWPTQEIAAPQGARGFAYYSIKDQAMVDAAEYGFMLWDGESKGTLNSVINMARQDKPVVVYLATKKIFQNIRSWLDVDDLLSNCDRASVQRFERELGIDLSQRLSHP